MERTVSVFIILYEESIGCSDCIILRETKSTKINEIIKVVINKRYLKTKMLIVKFLTIHFCSEIAVKNVLRVEFIIFSSLFTMVDVKTDKKVSVVNFDLENYMPFIFYFATLYSLYFFIPIVVLRNTFYIHCNTLILF